jgi:hypothetical protein
VHFLRRRKLLGARLPAKRSLINVAARTKLRGGKRFQENNPRRALPPPYEGEEKAFGRAVLGERSLEKTSGRRLPCQYGGGENAPGKSWEPLQ